jgi:hypothetical protein
MSEATIVEGKLEGTFGRWHENGQLAEQIEMKNDKPDGLARAFYPRGFRISRRKSARVRLWPVILIGMAKRVFPSKEPLREQR